MPKPAKVRSTDAIRSFQGELQRFAEVLARTLDELSHQCHLAVEWLEQDRMAYWSAQCRRASDRISEARINLERCQIAVRAEDRAPCTEEKKTLQEALQRLKQCEDKLRFTRRWVQMIRQEADDFKTALAKTRHMTDSEIPQAVARLEQILLTLERYTEPGSLEPPRRTPPEASS